MSNLLAETEETMLARKADILDEVRATKRGVLVFYPQPFEIEQPGQRIKVIALAADGQDRILLISEQGDEYPLTQTNESIRRVYNAVKHRRI